MIFVDTGYFVALLNPRDALRDRARAWAVVINEDLVISEYILWETANACSRGIPRTKLHTLVDEVRLSREYVYVEASRELLIEALRLHRQHDDKSWSLTDCTSFVIMNQRGITRALAHDHHFIQAGFQTLLARDPDVRAE